MNAIVRVLVVDDSMTMCGLISHVLSKDPQIMVVGQARNAMQAREMIKRLQPDVITLDIEMPEMNGLEFLKKIMTLRPMPVIMVSALTQQGADATLAALEIGAFDCVGKPVPGERQPFGDLNDKVKMAASSWRRNTPGRKTVVPPAAANSVPTNYQPSRRIVAIGSSTGGVEALMTVLSKFPANCPPTVITQHMPAVFTRSFAERLNRVCQAQVSEAEDGARLEIGHIYLAPGDRHLHIINRHAPICRLREAEPVNGHRPSVDVLFHSVAKTAGKFSIGVILTGMGRDGAAGLLEMRRVGASTIGQNKRSCVVYGMPRVAHEMGAVERQLPLDLIGKEILNLSAARKEGARLCH